MTPKDRDRKQPARVADPDRYRAPALEKGLDILELLVSERSDLSLSNIAQKLGRSTGELFRLLQVLQRRGFVEQSDESGAYRLSGRLLSLGMDQSAVKTLIEIAPRHMRQLALDIGQSCHLAMHSEGEIVVIARMESAELIGFSVRIGYRRPLMHTVSGLILYAYQPAITRRRWEEHLRPRPNTEQLSSFQTKADRVRKKGHALQSSEFVHGVTDISAPILRDDVAAAALTVPFLSTTSSALSLEESIPHIVKAARAISSELLLSDQRV
jgi:DNA-binding IclR family transcriptional regulator